MNIFVLVRAVIYATLFIAFVFIYLPARLLSLSGISRPAVFGGLQIAGMIVGICRRGDSALVHSHFRIYR